MAILETQDVMPVRSRVSWGAIVAGAVIALALYFLLSALGVALGLSAVGWVGERELGIGAAIWAIVTMLVSLFIGGWAATQFAVGENTTESVAYGVIVWGLVLAMLLGLMAGGVSMGFNAVIGLASSPAATAATRMNDTDLRALGFTQDQIDNVRGMRTQGTNAPDAVRNFAADPRTTAAGWWTFAGILLSMLAAIGGALAGSGPHLVLTAIRTRFATTGLRYPQAHETINR